MEAIKAFLVKLLCSFALAVVLFHAQSQSGFINIDCGLKEAYDIDETDANYTDTGINKEVDSKYKVGQYAEHLWTLRAFPEGKRNCYNLTLEPTKGSKFLIRVSFFYGNYDLLGNPPSFDVQLGPNVWLQSLHFENESTIITEEIIHLSSTDNIFLCLINTGNGIPFISYLELRQFPVGIYKTNDGSLWLTSRFDAGSLEGQQARYFGREWMPYTLPEWVSINTTQATDVNGSDYLQLPPRVMQTAAMPRNASEPLQFTLGIPNSTYKYDVYMHFAEIEKPEANQSREFNIFENGDVFYGPITTEYLSTQTAYKTISHYADHTSFSLERTENSTLPPIINAIELFAIVELPLLATTGKEFDAIFNIKEHYQVKRNWQGDPCSPKDYRWDGLNCSYNDSDAPIITHLNLSSIGLKGEIFSDIAELTSLRSLDLSNNNLSGRVPPSFTRLSFLTFLFLNGNNLTGPIPDELIKKYQNGSLDLRVDGDLKVYLQAQQGKKKIVGPLVSAFASLIVVSIALALVLWRYKRTQEDQMAIETKNRQLTYAEVLKVTNNFDRILGKGGFGSVYHGKLEDTVVAVKVLSPSSIQGHQQFLAEVNLLTRVHHKNLTTLIGYCNHGDKLALVYEYMANGDLKSHLSEESPQVLSWEYRLRIAVDTAQGLEYLHQGCKPPIIHRDIKSTNILLDEKFQAKLADFGLSKFFPNEAGCTHVSTIVGTPEYQDSSRNANESGTSYISTAIAGTPGYLDPEYYVSNRLNEKSDVFSYGIVLLELVSGKPVIMNTTNEKIHISEWVRCMLTRGELENIVDPRIQGEVEIDSVKKTIEVALTCVTLQSNKRPSMNEVVAELKMCLKMELLRKYGHDENEVTQDKDDYEYPY